MKLKRLRFRSDEFCIKYLEYGEKYLTQWRSDKKPYGLSNDTITFDLGWPWTVLIYGHYNYTSNISKTMYIYGMQQHRADTRSIEHISYCHRRWWLRHLFDIRYSTQYYSKRYDPSTPWNRNGFHYESVTGFNKWITCGCQKNNKIYRLKT